MARDSHCVFCKIVAVALPAHVVYEDERVIAFLDINPLSDGHLLVIPRDHYSALTDMPADEAAHFFSCVPKLGNALLEVTEATGFSVLINNGRDAGQVVAHVHAHLIPRKPLDDLGYRWLAGRYADGEAERIAAALQSSLSEH